jgi:hypothetical protein
MGQPVFHPHWPRRRMAVSDWRQSSAQHIKRRAVIDAYAKQLADQWAAGGYKRPVEFTMKAYLARLEQGEARCGQSSHGQGT